MTFIGVPFISFLWVLPRHSRVTKSHGTYNKQKHILHVAAGLLQNSQFFFKSFWGQDLLPHPHPPTPDRGHVKTSMFFTRKMGSLVYLVTIYEVVDCEGCKRRLARFKWETSERRFTLYRNIYTCVLAGK